MNASIIAKSVGYFQPPRLYPGSGPFIINVFDYNSAHECFAPSGTPDRHPAVSPAGRTVGLFKGPSRMRKFYIAAAVFLLLCAATFVTLRNLGAIVKANRSLLLARAEQALGRKIT